MFIPNAKFTELFPSAKNPNGDLVAALNEFLPQYEIDTLEKVACFLAQCGHESGYFSRFIENLNYSAAGLLTVFSKYFKTVDHANKYDRRPEAIANLVYANRMGNGDEASGDGWKYRGRGMLQITGRNNYKLFAESQGMTIDEAVEFMGTYEGSVKSACEFWKKNKLNDLCSEEQFSTLTRRINGGLNGLSDRLAIYKKARVLFVEVPQN